jgi:hypothetical protein
MSNNTRVSPSAQALPFFTLAVRYVIAPDVKPIDLAGDASSILESSYATVRAAIDGLAADGSQMADNPKEAAALLSGVLHQIEMAKNLSDAINTLEARA